MIWVFCRNNTNFLSTNPMPKNYIGNREKTFHLISVIIPAYNEAKNLNTLLPILEGLSEGHEVEIIVSVGDCAVNYSSCLGNLKRVKLIAQKRKGRGKQMNDGAAMAKGSILAFLHADVLPPTNFFNDIKQTISGGYGAGFFSYQFDKDSIFLRINASFTKRDGIFTGGGDQCLFIKKSIFEQLGRFDDHQVVMEDFEFFGRMKKAKIPYRIVKNDLLVSARKYAHNSYLRVNLSNLLLVTLFKCHYPPKKLRRLHDRLIVRPS